MRTPSRLLALLLAAALVLAACGGEASPKPAPLTKTPTASPSSAPLTSQPPVPEAVKGTDVAAAKAFVAYYVVLLGYATNTGDTKALKLLATDDCKTCNAATGRVEKIYARGGRVSGSNIRVDHFAEVKADNVGFKVDVDVKSSAEMVKETSTSSVVLNPARTVSCRFFLTTKPAGLYVDTWGCDK